MATATFLQDESGAVTVDYVVLTGAAVALALGVLTVGKDAVWNWLRLTEEQQTERGYVSGTWAAGIRDYNPANPLMHGALLEDFAQLTDEQLDTVEGFVNWYIENSESVATSETDRNMLTDLDFAMSHAYVSRYRGRPNSDVVDLNAMGAVAVQMGWDGSMSERMFGEPEPYPGDTFSGG